MLHGSPSPAGCISDLPISLSMRASLDPKLKLDKTGDDVTHVDGVPSLPRILNLGPAGPHTGWLINLMGLANIDTNIIHRP